uniref:Uncharacterized protein n=1 Tax=Tanacetum cinerariifolium TaxID=118510 RepID=A0A6L2JNP0_TANCI|nr:hypothetical protein [Tanacetum cinerariifolium]
MASKEEGETVKRKGLKLEQGSAKKIKTSEDVSKEDLKEMMQLVPVEEVYVEALQVKHPIIDSEIHTEGKKDYLKIIRLGGHTAVYQFFVNMLKQFDREDLNQLWTLVKETLSIRQALSDKEKELWVELKRLFEPDFEEQLDAPAKEVCTAVKIGINCGQRHINISQGWTSTPSTSSMTSQGGVPVEIINCCVSSNRTMTSMPKCGALRDAVGGLDWVQMTSLYCEGSAADERNFAGRLSDLLQEMINAYD